MSEKTAVFPLQCSMKQGLSQVIEIFLSNKIEVRDGKLSHEQMKARSLIETFQRTQGIWLSYS